MLPESLIHELIAAATEARRMAYAPYSGFAVGAALRTADGETFTGCNVENASIGLTICAERSAVCSAVAHGQRAFSAIAVVTSNGVSPCGACRQVLAEFGETLLVIMADLSGAYRVMSLADLLPAAFGPQHLTMV